MPYDTNRIVPVGGLDDHDSMTLDESKSPNMRNVRLDLDKVTRGPGATLFAQAPIPGTTDGAGMVTGSFTKKANGTGTQEVAHQLGIAPKAALFFAINAAANSDANQDSVLTIGMTDGTDDRCVTTVEKNLDADAIARRRARDACVAFLDTSGSVTAEAVFSAWDTDSFTLNWSTNDTGAWTIYYVLFGIDGMNAKVAEWTTGTSTGNRSYTGGSFTPTFAIHVYADVSGTGAADDLKIGVGMMSATAQGAACYTSEYDTGSLFAPNGTTDGSSSQTSSQAIRMIQEGSTTVDYEASFVSFNANGFTVSFGNAASSSVDVFTLLLDSTTASVHTFDRNLGSVPNTQSVTTPGFTPTGLLAVSNANTGASNVGEFMFGAAEVGGLGSVVYRASRAGANSATTDRARAISNKAGLFSGSNFRSTGSPEFFGQLQAMTSSGYDVTWITNNSATNEDRFIIAALSFGATAIDEVGPIRNFGQVYVGATGTEKLLQLAENTVTVYNSGTGKFDVSTEAYTITAGRRFYVANTQDWAVWAVDATASAPNLRYYDGSTFGDVVASGTNHKARFCIAFNDRIVSGYTYHTGAVHPTQLRWCRSGDIDNWDTSTGSAGVLEVIETSNAPLTGMFVMGERAYVTKAREIIELIPTGTTSPVFRQVTRIFGTGCIAPYSFGLGEFFVFFLGPDDVYLFDGSNLQSIGEPVRRTISRLINYNNLDDVQGEYLQSTAEYLLRIGNNLFVYDFRKQRWQRDFVADQTAIGRIRVGGLITTDVDHSEFLAMATTGNQTLRISENVTDILGGPIDSYIETKDFYATRPGRTEATTTLRSKNAVRSLAIQTDAGAMVEIGVSTDRGQTWDAEICTADADGIAQRFLVKSFSVVRFRFRSFNTEEFNVYGAYTYRWDTAGMVIGP